MGSENKSNVRQRKKLEKSNGNEQEVTTKDAVANGEENTKQKKQ